MSDRLQGAARVKAVQELADWADVPGRDAIHKTFRFKNFREAWGFMSQAALVARARKTCWATSAARSGRPVRRRAVLNTMF